MKLLMVIVFVIIILVLYLAIKGMEMKNYYSQRKKEIKLNWSSYRCKPGILAWAGWLGPSGTSTTGNAIDCAIMFLKNLFDKFMYPFYQFFETLLEVVFDLIKSVRNIRKMIYYLRDSIREHLLEIANLIYGYGKKISYLFNTITDITSKIFKVFEDIFFALGYAVTTLFSIWNGSIGGVGRFFCFHKNTFITMKDNSKKEIYRINIGDIIKEGGKVLAVHKYSGINTDLYKYKNIIVSGSHYVFENNKLLMVKDSPISKILEQKEKYIYCLTTEKGKILINNTLFGDYMEENKNINQILKEVLQKLNFTKRGIVSKIKSNEKIWGFYKNTIIKLKSGIYKKIKDIKINDILENNSVVEGVITINGNDINLYNYNNVISSGNIIVKNNNWKFINNIKISNKINIREEKLYNISTSNNQIIINNNIYTDYEQC